MKTQRASAFRRLLFLAVAVSLLLAFHPSAFSQDVLRGTDALGIRYASDPAMSPDGLRIAYVVQIPRAADDKPGPMYSELHVVSVKTGEDRPFVTGSVNVNDPQWSPDGGSIAFLMKRGDDAKTQVWAISLDGGESYQVTKSETNVNTYRWNPNGREIAYVATTAPTKREKELEKKGYGFIFFHEDWEHRNLYRTAFGQEGSEPEQLTENITIWNFEYSPDGTMIVASASEKNLIDYSYMFRRMYRIECATGAMTLIRDDPGKLGNYAISPDGSKLAYTAALDSHDNAVSQVFVMDLAGGASRNLTPDAFRGHVHWAGWKDASTIVYCADEGVWTTVNTVKAAGGTRTIVLDSRKSGVNVDAPSFTKDFKHFAFAGTSPAIPGDVFYWDGGARLKRLTTVNAWLSQKQLGKQTVITYPARDGLEIEGILIHPVGYTEGVRYPLIVIVHGGPESHYAFGWLTSYSQPAQVLAGEGFAVFLPNYRASTGYGVAFAGMGYNDAAGKEFDDIADGIDYLVASGIADSARVGLGGGSYGGYAAAWFSSYYTRYVRAVAMLAGISDLISKRGTTDIPYEELYVHSGKKLEDMWRQSLERSPIYYAHQSKSAVLILCGTADTRVSPSQSLEYYTRLVMNGHPAVRLVEYPGEGHGNRNQTGRADVLYRTLEWYNWYVRDAKPLDGPLPPLDVSESYGLTLGK
jgi:dipeptidyl aminopeptidase/acylaminoacyl peptidase